MKNLLALGSLVFLTHAAAVAGNSAAPMLADSACRLTWLRGEQGWQLQAVAVREGDRELSVGAPSGQYTVLYSAEAPPTKPVPISSAEHPGGFPEPEFRYITSKWADATSPVALNLAGEARMFVPEIAEQDGASWVFQHEDDLARTRATWMLDPRFAGDVRVIVTLTAKKAGWFSIATPTLAIVPRGELGWAMIPGVFQGATFEPNFVRAYAYGQGLPERPVLARERTTSTLASIVTTKGGLTLAAIAEPGVAADPWASDQSTRRQWKLGLSHLNRSGELSPTLYHPVLGQEGSRLEVGASVSFAFRYALRRGDWLAIERHAAYDLYQLGDFLRLKRPVRSLTDRVLAMSRYVVDDELSRWRTEDAGALTIGAQAYLGGVMGSDKDAMKNSDYGAMWMLARMNGDPRLVRERLPFARNFKLAQQETAPGFFEGAAIGQYYLSKSHRFTEEWGNYVEPVALTYYTMLDDGNILLFQPADGELRRRLRLGADRLLAWQRTDGSWAVAYDRATEKPLFTDLIDYRPTFYGLLVAYRILGDEKYLAAARRGADWLVREAVAPGRFLGVCGDTRFAPDFATAQIAGGLLDLYEVTQDARYRDAAVRTAQFYLASIYTHPVASTQVKKAGGAERQDWEISQVGLGFEHGGIIGSANGRGPILLASHAGLFIRLHQLTGEPLFRDLARAGALARDAFVDPKTCVASYYWDGMNRGPGPFPHHAWWQIGWITDYLVAEAALRTDGRVTFPRGFMTPKVGPHASYGFASGNVYGEPAALMLNEGLVTTNGPVVDYLTARHPERDVLFVIAMNESATAQPITLTLDPAKVVAGATVDWRKVQWLGANSGTTEANGGTAAISLPAYGGAVLRVEFARR